MSRSLQAIDRYQRYGYSLPLNNVGNILHRKNYKSKIDHHYHLLYVPITISTNTCNGSVIFVCNEQWFRSKV